MYNTVHKWHAFRRLVWRARQGREQVFTTCHLAQPSSSRRGSKIEPKSLYQYCHAASLARSLVRTHTPGLSPILSLKRKQQKTDMQMAQLSGVPGYSFSGCRQAGVGVGCYSAGLDPSKSGIKGSLQLFFSSDFGMCVDSWGVGSHQRCDGTWLRGEGNEREEMRYAIR